jgi:hypothetical protein
MPSPFSGANFYKRLFEKDRDVSRYLTTAADAKQILDYFNGFHDGFIRCIALHSYDSFVQEGPKVTDIVHRLTGRFAARIDIAHYNYQHGTQPSHRVVRCEFNNVKDFYLDLRNVTSHEWPIKYVDIRPLRKQNEQGQMTSYFILVFAWSKLLDNQWTERKEQVLIFQTAEFIEQ